MKYTIKFHLIDSRPSPTGLRVEVEVDENSITTEGFEMDFHTWGDSMIFGLGVNWIAM
jgi:hypothetical protein